MKAFKIVFGFIFFIIASPICWVCTTFIYFAFYDDFEDSYWAITKDTFGFLFKNFVNGD